MALTFTRGEVWWALVPYSDSPAQSKERPVVIIGASPMTWADDQIVLVAPITSFGGGAMPKRGDVAIPDIARAGLSKPSWIRARRFWGADPKALTSRAGEVDNQVIGQVLTEFAVLI